MGYKLLKTERFLEENELGEKLDIKVPIQVDSESGGFRIQVPDNLVDNFRRNKLGVTPARGNMKYSYHYGESKSAVVKNMVKCMKDYLACDKTHDLVIVYRHRNLTSFYKLVDGTICPNGSYDKEYNNRKKDEPHGKWVQSEGRDGSFSEDLGMGMNLYVQILARTIYSRPSGKSAKYTHFCYREQEDNSDMHSPKLFNSDIAHRLDEYIMKGSILESINNYHNTSMEKETGELKVIPYSDESAQFFCNMIDGICKLSDQFTTFFNNEPEEIVKYIASGGVALLEHKQ